MRANGKQRESALGAAPMLAFIFFALVIGGALGFHVATNPDEEEYTPTAATPVEAIAVAVDDHSIAVAELESRLLEMLALLEL